MPALWLQRGRCKPDANFLLDRGFLIKVPPSWRVLHARGRKLQGDGVAREAVAQRLGVGEPL